MIPVETPLTEWGFYVPGTPGEGEMPCLRRNGMTWSFWRVEPGDDVAGAGSVEALYQWPDPLPVGLGFATAQTPWESIETRTMLPEQVDGGVQASGALDEETRAFLASGGLLVVHVAAVPPPPVMVWLAPRVSS